MSEKKRKRVYENHYYCTRCRKYYPKEQFEESTAPRCPIHKQKLRITPHSAGFKREYNKDAYRF